jgi:hypothetical protein
MPNQTNDPDASPDPPPYDRDAIFHPNGPYNPSYMREAVRATFRTLPLAPAEPKGYADRRMHAALLGLSALHPRDEIEVMLGVQAMAAYHAAATCWHLGMNLHLPNGDSTRHITAACSAARTFDTMLRALERRQAKPLAVPIGRPAARDWDDAASPATVIDHLAAIVSADQDPPKSALPPGPEPVWTEAARAATLATLQRERTERENKGLDIANTEGILPGGGMILMDEPSPNQAAYMERRLGLMYQREYRENLRKGIDKQPKIRGLRVGDLVP